MSNVIKNCALGFVKDNKITGSGNIFKNVETPFKCDMERNTFSGNTARGCIAILPDTDSQAAQEG